jgi:hypothetical protein
MANKTKKVEVKEPQVQEEVVVKTTPVVKQPKTKPHPEDGWEIKDRQYFLLNNLSPLSFSLKVADIYYFDEEKGYERELKYTANQRTPFVDEFPEGAQARLEHVIFRQGVLHVPRNKQTLQKLLSLYHPLLNLRYQELNVVRNAESEIDILEFEIDALNAARNMDIDMAEAVLRVESGSKVSKMTSKEIKRDLLLYAKRNPKLFLELVTDENVQLRNFGIKAVEAGIIKLSTDQRAFLWSSNDRKLMNIPYEEHPYSALAAWFKTDEGMEIYSNIEKRLK